MEIKYYKKNVYGNELVYPLDHIDSLKWLTGQKTLSKAHMVALTAMGFNLVEVLGKPSAPLSATQAQP